MAGVIILFVILGVFFLLDLIARWVFISAVLLVIFTVLMMYLVGPLKVGGLLTALSSTSIKNETRAATNLRVGASVASVKKGTNASTISCVLENNKVVTVSRLSSNPTYSYGADGNNELVLPKAEGSSRVYKNQERFNAGGGHFIAFTNGVYTYVIYDGSATTWSFHGLRVYKNNEIIMERQCKQVGGLNFDYDSVYAAEGNLP